MKYFWHYSSDTTPKPLVDPRDLRPSDRLCVAATQTGLSSAKQKALVKEWCDLLPTLGEVRLLWLSSKVPQVLLEAACRMPALEGLWIKWSGVSSIASLANLTNLRYFHLGSSAKLESIDPLAAMTRLKWLGLENLSRVRELDPLAALTNLEGLALDGSMYSTWTVATLAPIGQLRGLRYLSLANLRAEDRTLGPLLGLRNLETLVTARWWDDAELAELRRKNPALEGS
jgi:hypothetical protein